MVQEIARLLIEQALETNAQDIYMIPREKHYDVFMRIGDERKFISVYEHTVMCNLISHFKFVSGMNVGEKRRTQLGSCEYALGNEMMVSLRLSSVGDYKGRESLVIRVLYSKQQSLHYWFDGMKELKDKIGERGLYLFSGPVGSGKTTLMYQLIMEKYAHKQVISIEDPVELKDERILQLQLNDSIGMTYDNLIKLSLRHRPDILIIGEIRDSETARAVIRASLTGAIVFSTIHAKSISGVYDRLLELGVREEELKNSLSLIAYQRLIGGGALIDYKTESYQDYYPKVWNQRIDQLFEQGYLTEEQRKTEKIKSYQAT